ncbi:conserved hypothetical protein [Ricinus communis]|uniref:Uncharacterized protein n=1 Tax=Ricinus communis TaxID=3988 RepID=B9S212_RICCO|nr:conserved hypothetical protein [Ricinus communis]
MTSTSKQTSFGIGSNLRIGVWSARIRLLRKEVHSHHAHGPTSLPTVMGTFPFPSQRLGWMRNLLHEERVNHTERHESAGNTSWRSGVKHLKRYEKRGRDDIIYICITPRGVNPSSKQVFDQRTGEFPLLLAGQLAVSVVGTDFPKSQAPAGLKFEVYLLCEKLTTTTPKRWAIVNPVPMRLDTVGNKSTGQKDHGKIQHRLPGPHKVFFVAPTPSTAVVDERLRSIPSVCG